MSSSPLKAFTNMFVQNRLAAVVILCTACICGLFYLAAINVRQQPTGPTRSVAATLYKKTHYSASVRLEAIVIAAGKGVATTYQKKDVPEYWTAQVHYEKRVNDCPITQAQYEGLVIRKPIEITLQKDHDKEICTSIQ